MLIFIHHPPPTTHHPRSPLGVKYIPDIYIKREGLADMLWRAGAACYGIPGNTAGRVHRALSVQGEIRPPMEISMGHGIFHGPWKFPWALEISRTWNFPWAMEISMGNASITAMEISRTWKFPVAYLLGGLEVPSISEWFETITFKERSKGEHYRIQLKFVALRKLSLSIERLKIEHF